MTDNHIYQTYSGLAINPFKLRPEDIRIVDIARALSNQCRFAGHVKSFYSVAEHSVHCSYLVPQVRKDPLWALLHDASEAYIQDIVSPIKSHWSFFEYRQLEKEIQGIINSNFGLSLPAPESIKLADQMMLRREAEVLLGTLNPAVWDSRWIESIPPTDIKLCCFNPKEAEAAFLRRFWEIAYT